MHNGALEEVIKDIVFPDQQLLLEVLCTSEEQVDEVTASLLPEKLHCSLQHHLRVLIVEVVSHLVMLYHEQRVGQDSMVLLFNAFTEETHLLPIV